MKTKNKNSGGLAFCRRVCPMREKNVRNDARKTDSKFRLRLFIEILSPPPPGFLSRII
jgi:hypothetical protein